MRKERGGVEFTNGKRPRGVVEVAPALRRRVYHE